MRILVTGTSGHLGEALARVLPEHGHEVVGLDVAAGPFTTVVGSIADAGVVADAMTGAAAVLHTATLHKPHVVTHTRREFVDTNIVGTLNLLEAAAKANAAFVFTSTTSVFGRALTPADGEPTAWITDDIVPLPKNIYGVTKKSAEELCELFHRKLALPCLILRTSRFFPDEDDDASVRAEYSDDNVKVNELLYRRADIEDIVAAHVLALARARSLGFGRYILSATTPFAREHAAQLRTDAPNVLRRLFPEYAHEYQRRGWRMFPGIDRVYVNSHARHDLGWEPRWTFGYLLQRLREDADLRSVL